RETTAAAGDTRVVEQQVARAVLPEDGVRQGLDGARVGDVGEDAGDLAPVRELRDGGIEHRPLDVGDHDASTFVEQRLDDAAADAIGAARDDRDPAVQIAQVAYFSHSSAPGTRPSTTRPRAAPRPS